MQIKDHFTLMVYPFVHSLSGRTRRAHLKKLNSRWQHWWTRLGHREVECVLDDTYFFLPYIRRLLFPETSDLPAGAATEQVGTAIKLAQRPTHQLAKTLSSDGVLRLRCDLSQLGLVNKLHLEFERKGDEGKIVDQFSERINLHWVDVALFPQNVGLLILKLHWFNTDGPDATITGLNDLLYYLRLVHPPTIDWALAKWKSEGKETLTFTNRQLVDFLLQGVTEGPYHLDPTIAAFLENDSGCPYSATEMGQVYGQAFRQYTYVCVDTSPILALSGDSAGTQRSPVPDQTKSPLFDSYMQQVVYELATCTRANNPEEEPHRIGLEQIMEKGHIALWANWEGMALHDNVVFLDTRQRSDAQNKFAHNVEYDYFHLYLLTLYQKVRLSLLSGQLLRQASDLHHNLREARGLWSAFLMFRNHYWFAEVTFKPQGTELYRRFQRGLDVLPLFELISDEVRDLQEYYERKAERRIGSFLTFLTFVGLPAGILTQLFGGALIKEASWKQFLWVAVIVYITIALVWLLWRQFRRE